MDPKLWNSSNLHFSENGQIWVFIIFVSADFLKVICEIGLHLELIALDVPYQMESISFGVWGARAALLFPVHQTRELSHLCDRSGMIWTRSEAADLLPLKQTLSQTYRNSLPCWECLPDHVSCLDTLHTVTTICC